MVLVYLNVEHRREWGTAVHLPASLKAMDLVLQDVMCPLPTFIH